MYFITYQTGCNPPTQRNGVIALHPLAWRTKYDVYVTLLFYKEIDEDVYNDFKDENWNYLTCDGTGKYG